mmetsp:Transcript_3168/g.7945  ORF Transcript_3168/g.7945 Transcript_3168/m.7945 type:complete len:80 (-) Transcript_3168:161-400(-)
MRLFALLPMNSMAGGLPMSMLGAHSEYCFSDGSWCADGLPNKEIPITNTGYIYPAEDTGLGNGGFQFSTWYEGPGTNEA